MDNWPEFIYGDKTIREYVQLVQEQKRDPKLEILALVDLIRDISKYPSEDPDQTFLIISSLCKGIRALLSQLDSI